MENGWHSGECLCSQQREGSQHYQMSQPCIKRISDRVTFMAIVGLIVCFINLAVGAAVIVGFHNLRSGQNDGHQSSTQQQQQQYESPSALLTAPERYNLSRIKYLEWETKEGNAHLQGFGYDNGDLVVFTSGFYRIYLQITYSSYLCSNENEHFSLSQEVVLYADNYKKDRILFQSLDSVECKVKTRKSISSTASFSLNAKDRLRVSALKPDLIVTDEKQVYFGVDLQRSGQ